MSGYGERERLWRANLKPGDIACLPGYGLARGDYAIVTVKRITPTGRIVVSTEWGRDQTYDKHGRLIGRNKWSSCNLTELTDEMIATKRLIKMRNYINGIDLRKLDDEQVELIYKLVVTFEKDPGKPPV